MGEIRYISPSESSLTLDDAINISILAGDLFQRNSKEVLARNGNFESKGKYTPNQLSGYSNLFRPAAIMKLRIDPNSSILAYDQSRLIGAGITEKEPYALGPKDTIILGLFSENSEQGMNSREVILERIVSELTSRQAERAHSYIPLFESEKEWFNKKGFKEVKKALTNTVFPAETLQMALELRRK